LELRVKKHRGRNEGTISGKTYTLLRNRRHAGHALVAQDRKKRGGSMTGKYEGKKKAVYFVARGKTKEGLTFIQ